MPNAYEKGERKAIPAVLVYPRCGDEVLMLHRNARPEDFHAGKWNGLGGKCEPDESPLDAAVRELREESGLALPAGAFRPLVFVFTAAVAPEDRREGLPCPEGALHWVHQDELLRLNLWDGDREFLPLMLAGKPFIGTLWYEGGRLARHWLRPL